MVAEQQAESKVKRVWILGAGFSRPLGGPLLADLFTMRGWREVESTFPLLFPAEGEFPEHAQKILGVYLLYQWGAGYQEGSLFGMPPKWRGERLFKNAEDFLVQLERLSDARLSRYLNKALEESGEMIFAADDPLEHAPLDFEVHNSLVNRLRPTLGSATRSDLLLAAKRLMALECSAFHKSLLFQEDELKQKYGKALMFEPFIPYRAWFRTLDQGDHIISFNYDAVSEFFASEVSVEIEVLKMHGTVEEAVDRIGYSRLDKPEYDPKIGIPGTAKANHFLHNTWERAGRILQNAQHVTFLGYGLPESDAHARAFLLTHLRTNSTRHLKIEIVLGEPSFRTQRLDATLRQALAHRMHSREVREAHVTELNHSEGFIRNLKDWLERGQFPVTLLDGEGEQANIRDADDAKKRLILEEQRFQRLTEDFKELTLTVLPQYAQDYMQGFATSEGGG